MRRPRKILHVLPSLDESYGGPLRLVLELSARAEGLCLSTQIVGIGDLAVNDNPLDRSQIHTIPGGSWGRYAYTPGLRPWMRAHVGDFDGVIIHGAWAHPGWAAAIECWRKRVPYGYYPHGMLEQWAVRCQGLVNSTKKSLYWFYRERLIAGRARCTFFTTEREREFTRRVFRIGSSDRILRPYGMDPFAAPMEGTKEELRPGRHVALFLGRLHPKKNVEFLIEAWRKAQMPQSWRLVIAGSGEPAYEAKVRRAAGGLAETGSVQFTGFVSGIEKRRLLQQADWFLLPSQQENFGVAVLEAVEQGCGIAISNQVYLAESFRPESEVLPLNLEAWVEFLRTRMRDLEWRRRTGEEDRKHLMNTFQMDEIVKQWTATFLDLFPQRVLACL